MSAIYGWIRSWYPNTTITNQPVWKSSPFYANVNKIAAVNAVQSSRELFLTSTEWSLLIFHSRILSEGMEYWRQYRVDYDLFPLTIYEYLALWSWSQSWQQEPVDLKGNALLLQQYQHALKNRIQLQTQIRQRNHDRYSRLSVDLHDDNNNID